MHEDPGNLDKSLQVKSQETVPYDNHSIKAGSNQANKKEIRQGSKGSGYTKERCDHIMSPTRSTHSSPKTGLSYVYPNQFNITSSDPSWANFCGTSTEKG